MKGGSGIERLDGWVTLQAARRPDSTAVMLGDDRLTCGELEALANRLARCLIEGGCRRGDRIAVLMPKTPVAIAAIVAIYKAGAIYVPLDPAGPATRLALILRSCEPRWILAAGPVAQLLDDLLDDESARDAVRVGWLGSEPPQAGNFQADFTGSDLQRFPDAAVDIPTSRHDAAHILFTSGSTGTPKGVVITHSNVLHFVEWAVRYFAMAPEDRISGHSPLFFDLSVLDIFGAFAAGGELHLVPPDLNILPHKLAEFIRRSALTQWFSVPSVLNYM
ncbi:MAG TPA: AMP-binding protein, partial [bacterium]|nr:AMP-binding protein [bacterium]